MTAGVDSVLGPMPTASARERQLFSVLFGIGPAARSQTSQIAKTELGTEDWWLSPPPPSPKLVDIHMLH